MSNNIEGKVVVITGASSGLGEATARLLSAEGASVVLGARRAERIQSLAEELTGSGGKALAVTTDVTQFDQVKKLVDTAVETTVISPGAYRVYQPPAGPPYFNRELCLVSAGLVRSSHMRRSCPNHLGETSSAAARVLISSEPVRRLDISMSQHAKSDLFSFHDRLLARRLMTKSAGRASPCSRLMSAARSCSHL